MNSRTRTSRFRQIYADLRGQITSARLQPGDRLATESELASQYGVSVLTVRQAQGLLVEDGLITKQQGRGTFVSELPARSRRVLMICGIPVETGIGAHSYYANTIRGCRRQLEAAGATLEVVWIENHDAAAAAPYLESDRLRDFSGFIFFGCVDLHPVFTAVRQTDANWTLLGRVAEGPNRVWMDFASGVRQGLQALQAAGDDTLPLTIVSLTGIQCRLIESLLATLEVPVEHLLIEYFDSTVEFEIESYRAVRDHVARLAGGRYLFTDDVIARGATRALLEAQTKRSLDLHAAVLCGVDEVIPYGLPVTYVVHDAASECCLAVADLLAQIDGAPGESVRSAYISLGECSDISPSLARAAGPDTFNRTQKVVAS